MNDEGVVDHGKSWTFSGGEAARYMRADRHEVIVFGSSSDEPQALHGRGDSRPVDRATA
jgi:hypothetical protein